jgi:hypothetical protein
MTCAASIIDSGFSDAYVMVVPVGFRLIQADFWWIW